MYLTLVEGSLEDSNKLALIYFTIEHTCNAHATGPAKFVQLTIVKGIEIRNSYELHRPASCEEAIGSELLESR